MLVDAVLTRRLSAGDAVTETPDVGFVELIVSEYVTTGAGVLVAGAAPLQPARTTRQRNGPDRQASLPAEPVDIDIMAPLYSSSHMFRST